MVKPLADKICAPRGAVHMGLGMLAARSWSARQSKSSCRGRLGVPPCHAWLCHPACLEGCLLRLLHTLLAWSAREAASSMHTKPGQGSPETMPSSRAVISMPPMDTTTDMERVRKPDKPAPSTATSENFQSKPAPAMACTVHSSHHMLLQACL